MTQVTVPMQLASSSNWFCLRAVQAGKDSVLGAEHLPGAFTSYSRHMLNLWRQALGVLVLFNSLVYYRILCGKP